MITEKNSIVKIDSFNIGGACAISVKSDSTISSATLIVCDNAGNQLLSKQLNTDGKTADGTFNIENPNLWNVYSPYLYKYNLVLNTANGKEDIFGTFGVRELKSAGKNLNVNGNPVFLRGYIRGTTAHDHANNCNLSKREFFRKNISQAKKFGFNFVRFHSAIPDEEFFNMADELGMLIHIELRELYDEYNNLEEMIKTKPLIVTDEFIENVVSKVYNHPSMALYCIGNEIKGMGASDRAKEIGKLINKLDNSRLFIDTCAWGQNNRDGVDIDIQHLSYYFPFGKHAGMYEDTDNLLVVGVSGGDSVQAEGVNSEVTRALYFNVPLISHEVCHYTALRDFKALKEKFERYGTPAPWWVDEELKMIDAKGLTDSYDEMYKASKSFQLECWKTAFEEMRKSKLLGGFQFLQFADTDVYENSNGLVDCFDDESYITPEQVAKFNGDITLLTSLGSRLFFGGKQLVIPVELSNCSEKDYTVADFNYKLTDINGDIFAQGELKNMDISRHGLYDLCKVKINLSSVKKAEKFTITMSLTDKNGVISYNDWKIWVYPEREKIAYKDFCNYEKGIACVTDNINKAFELLEQGKNVCLVYRSDWTRHLLDKQMKSPEYAFKATWNRFKPVIWDRGTNYGGLCDTKTLNEYGFTTDRFYDFNYSVITEDCDKVILDDFPVKVKSIISGIDKSVRDRFDAYAFSFNLPELQYDRTLRDFSYLFELKVGKGKLLVCGLNMTGLDEHEPSTTAMADFIVNYISGKDFNPSAEISVKELKEYMQGCAKQPVKERMMTQFWQLDDTPVESEQYWEDSRKYLE